MNAVENFDFRSSIECKRKIVRKKYQSFKTIKLNLSLLYLKRTKKLIST